MFSSQFRVMQSLLFIAGLGVGFILTRPESKPEIVWTNVELENAIAESIADGTPVELPTRTVLTSTVHVGLGSSVRFQGSGGRLINYNLANSVRTGGSRIYWKGPADQPIFVTAGVGNEWNGITFVLDNPTSACIQVMKGAGLGSGKHVIDSCSFLENPLYNNQSVGVVMGVTIGDGNCDETTIKESVFVNTKSMFESKNHQSVGNKLFGNQTIRNQVAINCMAGGKMAVFGHSSVRDQTILRLGEQGSGNNNFVVYGLSVDAAAPDGWLLIDNPLRRNVFVTMTGHLSSQAGGPRSELVRNDNANFNLTGLAGVQADALAK